MECLYLYAYKMKKEKKQWEFNQVVKSFCIQHQKETHANELINTVLTDRVMQGLVSLILRNAQGTFRRVCAAEKEKTLEITHFPPEKGVFVRDHPIAEETFAGYLLVCTRDQRSAQFRKINVIKWKT